MTDEAHRAPRAQPPAAASAPCAIVRVLGPRPPAEILLRPAGGSLSGAGRDRAARRDRGRVRATPRVSPPHPGARTPSLAARRRPVVARLERRGRLLSLGRVGDGEVGPRGIQRRELVFVVVRPTHVGQRRQRVVVRIRAPILLRRLRVRGAGGVVLRGHRYRGPDRSGTPHECLRAEILRIGPRGGGGRTNCGSILRASPNVHTRPLPIGALRDRRGVSRSLKVLRVVCAASRARGRTHFAFPRSAAVQRPRRHVTQRDFCRGENETQIR